MKSFKDFHKIEVVKDVIDELENMKIYHNFQKPISKDFLTYLADRLNSVGIEPDDIYACMDAPGNKQKEYLFYKSVPGGGMGYGALKDLRKILHQLEK
jgi:hypothetical protein